MVLNPHYKDTGNLHSPEYRTYLLPGRAGGENTRRVTEARLPMGIAEARRLGLVDRVLPSSSALDPAVIARLARTLAMDAASEERLAEKRSNRSAGSPDAPALRRKGKRK